MKIRVCVCMMSHRRPLGLRVNSTNIVWLILCHLKNGPAGIAVFTAVVLVASRTVSRESCHSTPSSLRIIYSLRWYPPRPISPCKVYPTRCATAQHTTTQSVSHFPAVSAPSRTASRKAPTLLTSGRCRTSSPSIALWFHRRRVRSS